MLEEQVHEPLGADLDVADPGEATVREAFAKLHDAYADAMSDPFAAPGRPIENARFKARVRALAAPA